jgi:3-oxoacyl-[acyl-carrier-protein] synthase II
VETQWRRLLRGDSAIALQQPFPDLPARPLALVGATPSRPEPLLLTAVAQAIKDAQLSCPQGEMAVVVGSSRGYQAHWEAYLRGAPMADWLGTLPHSGATAVARYLGSQGPAVAPMLACATGLWAIAQGRDLIVQGQCDRVLVAAVEAAVTPMTLVGFEQMRALAPMGCYPFDRQRQGLVLGEGAVALVLERCKAAQARGAEVYGRVGGGGFTADAHHVSAPAIASGSGLTAIRQSLARSDRLPREVDFIHAHGTGTQRNDAYEATLIQTLFDHPVAVGATKGATGHTLGASGAMGAAVCLLALRHQWLPPCVGLREPAFALNLVRQATPAPIQTTLCFSFGFGGQNGVLALLR